MDDIERDNWQRIKDHFETLPEFKRDNDFYRRACTILAGGKDPLELPEVKTED